MKGTVKSFKQKINEDGVQQSFVAFNKILYPHVMTADIEGMKGETTGEVNVTALPAWFEIGGIYEFQCTPDDRADGGWKFKVSKIREQAQPAPQQTSPANPQQPTTSKTPNVDDRERFKQGSIEAQQAYNVALTFYDSIGIEERLKLETASKETDLVLKKVDVISKLANAFGEGIRALANELERPF